MNNYIPLKSATNIASKLLDKLLPDCHACAVAGSVRRGKPFVHDIDIVLMPKTFAPDLFGDPSKPAVDFFSLGKLVSSGATDTRK